ncbi:MAG: hypothetical protein ACXQTX_03840 [Candidatus Syntropharchaeia archaeon]
MKAGDDMKIGSVFSRFWSISADFDLSPSEISLFFAILAEINRARPKAEDSDLLEVEVEISSRRLEILSRLSSSQILRLRNRLAQLGFIRFSKGKGKRHYATYALGELFHKNPFTGEGVNDGENEGVSGNPCTSEGVNDGVSRNPCTGAWVNEGVNDGENEGENDGVNDGLYKEFRDKSSEYRENNKNKKNNKLSPYGESCESDDSLGLLLKPFREEHPSLYASLNRYQQNIIDTWESVVGTPWKPDWLNDLREALAVCYPAQVRSAITATAQTNARALKERGFPYLKKPLLNGAFGKKGVKRGGKNRKDSGKDEWLETFKNPAGRTIPNEILDQIILSSNKKRSDGEVPF